MLRWGASTVGPSNGIRATSKATANATGATIIAQRDLVSTPAMTPIARLTTTEARAAMVVCGDRGVSTPATTPHPAARTTATTQPRRTTVDVTTPGGGGAVRDGGSEVVDVDVRCAMVRSGQRPVPSLPGHGMTVDVHGPSTIHATTVERRRRGIVCDRTRASPSAVAGAAAKQVCDIRIRRKVDQLRRDPGAVGPCRWSMRDRLVGLLSSPCASGQGAAMASMVAGRPTGDPGLAPPQPTAGVHILMR